MKRYLHIALGVVLTALGASANASVITVSDTFSPVVVVDASSATRTLLVGSGGAITDVDVFVDFTKCDSPINSNGDCVGTGFSFNGELGLAVTSPGGTVVNLVCNGSNCSPDTYSGSTPGARVGVTFDDEAATAVGGSSLVSGTFRPAELLSLFDGEDALGTWSITISDNVGADPASLNAWTLQITTVSEPAVLSLMALALLGFAMRRRAA